MKEILVTSKKYGTKKVLIDDADYDSVSKIKWGIINKGYGKLYVATQQKITWRRVTPLHRFLMGEYEGDCDHGDGDTFNNQRYNLRVCTHKENTRNRSIQKINKTGFKGMYFVKRISKYRVQISVDDKTKHIGYYWTIIEAAKAYNEAVTKYYGEFAKLNTIPS